MFNNEYQSIKEKALQTRESIFCLQSIAIALKVHHNYSKTSKNNMNLLLHWS